MSLRPGTRLGPYQVGEPLGAGGMGEVYRARDTRLDRSVAIKVLPTHLSSLPDLRARFEREARAISSLNHPHICALHDIGSEDGVDYLVMEYLEGQTLADRLADSARHASSSATLPGSRALKLEEALVIAQQIADALDTAHRQGVVHRDLKPGNIMLTAAGAKLLDFGLAKQSQPAVPMAGHSFAPTSPQPLTAHGTLLGTLQYMSPEQLEGRDADARTDVFAFGAVLYEMVTGRRAFEGKTQVSVLALIVDHDPPPVSSLAPVSPKLLDHLVKNCLAKNPDKRWQSMADVSLQLRLITESLGEADTGAANGAVTRRLRRARLAAAAVAVMLATAAAAAVAWWLMPAAPEPLRLQFDLPTPVASGPNQIAVSPRGTHIVTLASSSGGVMLWLAALERGTGEVIPGTNDAQWPFWSPDGRSIAFFAGGKLKRAGLAGTPPQTLANAPNGTGGAWNSDDVIVFAPDLSGPLLRVPAAGGEPRPATELDKAGGEVAHRHPWFLPDGRRFIYVAVNAQPERSAIVLASLDSSERHELVSSAYRAAFAPPDRLLFMRDSTLLAQPFDTKRRQLAGDPYPIAHSVGVFAGNSAAGFSVSANGVLVYRNDNAAGGTSSLRWFDRQGVSTPAFEVAGEYQHPALSRDLQRIAVGRLSAGQASASDLWLLDLTRGTSTRFTFDAAPDQRPLWSPDGTSVIFSSNRESGIFNLYQKRASGIEPEQLLYRSERHKWPEDLSADGRLLVYTEVDPNTGNDLWVLPLTGEGKPQPVVRSPFNDVDAAFSPDGRWIAYASGESGRLEVFVLSFPDAASRIQISTGGGARPVWRADGKELFFVVPGPPDALMSVDFSVTDGGVLKAGRPRRLFEARVLGRYGIAPDGGRFLINTPVQSGAFTETPVLKVRVNWVGATP